MPVHARYHKSRMPVHASRWPTETPSARLRRSLFGREKRDRLLTETQVENLRRLASPFGKVLNSCIIMADLSSWFHCARSSARWLSIIFLFPDVGETCSTFGIPTLSGLMRAFCIKTPIALLPFCLGIFGSDVHAFFLDQILMYHMQ